MCNTSTKAQSTAGVSYEKFLLYSPYAFGTKIGFFLSSTNFPPNQPKRTSLRNLSEKNPKLYANVVFLVKEEQKL